MDQVTKTDSISSSSSRSVIAGWHFPGGGGGGAGYVPWSPDFEVPPLETNLVFLDGLLMILLTADSAEELTKCLLCDLITIIMLFNIFLLNTA